MFCKRLFGTLIRRLVTPYQVMKSSYSYKPSVAVSVTSLLVCIPEVPSTNLSQETCYHDSDFTVVFLRPLVVGPRRYNGNDPDIHSKDMF